MTELLLDRIQRLPKVELHRHLEGSMRIETLLDVARKYDRELANITLEYLRPFVQMVPGQPFTSEQFLGKFKVLRQFYNSPETIRRIAREVVIDAAKDNIRYMELRFTPKALTNVLMCSYDDVMGWVCDTVHETATQHGVKVRLIVSMNRHESVKVAEEVLDVAIAHRDRGVVGIDLAGAEATHSCKPFAGVFRRAREAGLRTTVHAGEWAGASSVRDAVVELGADRIGHGIRAVEDDDVLALLVERGTVLEVCPTSNLHSGVLRDLNQHPLIALYNAGVKTTINTDDPLISNITLTSEMLDVMFNMKFTLDDMQRNVLNAAHGAFLPPAERAELAEQFQAWFASEAEKHKGD